MNFRIEIWADDGLLLNMDERSAASYHKVGSLTGVTNTDSTQELNYTAMKLINELDRDIEFDRNIDAKVR